MLSKISSLPYYLDATVTKLAPGILLDKLFSTGASSKWGEAKGKPNLNDFTSLQGRKWYSPFELFKTESVLAGRKAYYASAAMESFSKAVSAQAGAIKTLVAKQFPDSSPVTQKTIKSNARDAMMSTWEAPSLMRYADHPYTRNRLYLSWGLRLGALYYLSPFESRALSVGFVAFAVFPYTALLVPGARRELSCLRTPKIQKEFSFSEECRNKIYTDVERLAGAFESLKKTLNKISFNIIIEDPFLNDRHYKAAWKKAKEAKEKEIVGSPERYDLGWQEQTALIGYYGCKNMSEKKKEAVRERLDLWKDWKRTNEPEAISFWRRQTDVAGSPPNENKSKANVKILDRRRT